MLLAVTIVTMVTFMIPYPKCHVAAYPSFRDLIPNGRNVVSPCVPLLKVFGVGHKNPFGGGERNAFGMTFSDAQYKWTTAVCQADSDGDGMTNGEELGDPSCTWPSSGPNRTTAITHPGINNNQPQCLRRLLELFTG